MKSCMGYILEVDLTKGEINKTKVPEKVYREVLSGKGLGVWYCLRNIPEGADPMGPDNVLGLVSGSLTGTGALFSGRWTLVGKSPLTGGWGDASCGGMFAPAIKQCGIDGIFFKGVAEKPVYLYMDNKTCELRDASAYWGLDASEAEERLTQDNWDKKKPRVAVIGQAGENKSCIAGVCNEGGRIAARSGLGGVMGSKNLKAVVLAGSKPIPCADSDTVKELSRVVGQKVKKAGVPSFFPGVAMGLAGYFMAFPIGYPLDGSLMNMMIKQWGTGMNAHVGIKSGDSPLKNWKGSRKDIPKAITRFSPDLLKNREQQKYHCYSCPLGCGGVLDIKDVRGGEFSHTHKPEYETINQFGGLLLNTDMNTILYINELLNRAGMDSISAGGTVAFAMECYEQGILSREDLDGIDLAWGNPEAIVELVKKMIARDGIGDVLADGSKKAAERIGKSSEKLAIHAGGMELPAHDSRKDPGLALHYQTQPAPGKHTVALDLMYNSMALWDICSWAPPVNVHHGGKDAEPTMENALGHMANVCYSMLTDGAGVCMYGEMQGVHTFKMVEYLNAAAGWNLNGDEYMEIGHRIETMRQLFNVKQGIEPAKVRLPSRAMGFPALKEGPLKGASLTRSREQVALYWDVIGWDKETGVPLPSTLEDLGINELVELEVA